MSSNSDSSSNSPQESGTLDNLLLTVAQEAVQILRDKSESSTQSTRQPTLERDRAGAHQRLINDYFCDEPVYDAEQFRRRFRMSRHMFLRVTGDLERELTYFKHRENASGKLGFSALQKCTAAIRQLAYGMSVDVWDEYLRMSEHICRDSLYHFCEGNTELYARRYLRNPTASDVPLLYAAHQGTHGFPGMLGCLDCTHWEWAACPTAWKGQHTRGDHNGPSLILQAVASQDLWIWHAFFGMAGANNDIAVLNSLNIFDDVIDGVAQDTSFYANDVHYKYRYYLVDGIYPEWAVLMKTFSCPDDAKRLYYKRKHESARKDVERAFGVLKKRWTIIDKPSHILEKKRMRNVMYTCIILHNMILEDTGRAICAEFDETVQPTSNPILTYAEKETIRMKIRNRDTHLDLRADLVEHLWLDRL